MTSPLQTLSEKDLNLLRNDRIKFELCPLVYQTIIEWGFEKPKGVKIIDHFKDRKIEEKCGRNLKNWLKNNKKALDTTHFLGFDVTTLHDLLPVLCYDSVSQTGGKEWEVKLKDTNSIEYLLKEIKTFRNDVSHEYAKAKNDPNIKAMQELLSKCIRTAGTLYSKDQSVVDAKISGLIAKFDELVHETFTYPNAVEHVAKFVEKESAPFMLEKYSELFSVPLPGGLGKVGTAQIFESVYLSVAVADKNNIKKKNIVFSSNEICNHIKNKFVVINGDPGTGKTTLMRNLYQNILDNSVNGCEMSYEGIGRFKVPIFLECRTERQSNLRDFLKESIPNFHASNEVIYDAFKEMKGHVFLIDGYDEVNDDSRKLVDEIIPFCTKYSATCIVSGRVDAGNNFISKLKKKELTYNEMLLEHISKISNKLSYLRRYGDKMGNVDSVELEKSFENLNDSAQKVFSSPVLLTLFISLFLNNRNSLSQLHNEQSAYKAIREIFYEDIMKKLEESNVKNPELRAKYLLEVFSDYSFRLFRKKEHFFGQEEILSLTEDCLGRIQNMDVDIKRIFSCILTPETSLKSGKSTYAFTHSSIQEYLAVGQVMRNMRGSNIDWNSEQLSEDSLREQFLAILDVSDYEVRRYGNIIKLLMLELTDRNELDKYARTFTAVQREYFVSYYNVFHLDLVSSSNCDSAIVSIVSDVLRDKRDYNLRYTRLIRPLTEVLKKRQTTVIIYFNCSESLTDTDSVNLGHLVSVLKDGSKIELNLHHSHNNFQPLKGEFYKQLKNSKCWVLKFKGCVTSSEDLSSLMRVWSPNYNLYISTVSVSACDVSFAPLERYIGWLHLLVKYTDGCPSTGSNPVPMNTIITILDIPADGKDAVKRIIKYLSPKSKQFRKIQFLNCHLTDTDVNEPLKKLEEEKIRTEWGEITKVEEMRVNEDKSRNLLLILASQ